MPSPDCTCRVGQHQPPRPNLSLPARAVGMGFSDALLGHGPRYTFTILREAVDALETAVNAADPMAFSEAVAGVRAALGVIQRQMAERHGDK